MSEWILMMTAEDISLQQQSALTEKVLKNIHLAKKYVTVVKQAGDTKITVEMESTNGPEIIDWIQQTVDVVYSKYTSSPELASNLYAALAFTYPNSSITISFLNPGGCGYTTKFNPNTLAR